MPDDDYERRRLPFTGEERDWIEGRIAHGKNGLEMAVQEIFKQIARFLTAEEIAELVRRGTARRWWNGGFKVSDDPERPGELEAFIRERVDLLTSLDFPVVVAHVRKQIKDRDSGKEREKRLLGYAAIALPFALGLLGSPILHWLGWVK